MEIIINNLDDQQICFTVNASDTADELLFRFCEEHGYKQIRLQLCYCDNPLQGSDNVLSCGITAGEEITLVQSAIWKKAMDSMKATVFQAYEMFKALPTELKSDSELVIAAIRNVGPFHVQSILRDLSTDLLNDPSVISEALLANDIARYTRQIWEMVPITIKKYNSLCIVALRQSSDPADIYSLISLEFQQDNAIVDAALSSSAHSELEIISLFREFPSQVQVRRDVIFRCIDSLNGPEKFRLLYLMFTSENRSDKCIVKRMFDRVSRGQCLAELFMSLEEELRGEYEFVMKTLNCCSSKIVWKVFGRASPDMRDNTEVVLAALGSCAVSSYGLLFLKFSEKISCNKSIVLQIVSQTSGTVSKCVFDALPTVLKADFDVVSVILERSRDDQILHIFKTLPSSLKSNKDIVLLALSKSEACHTKDIFKFSDDVLKSDKEVVDKALSQSNPFYLENIIESTSTKVKEKVRSFDDGERQQLKRYKSCE